MELFCSVWVWASGLSAPAELLLGEPSGLSERGAARSAPAARRGAPKPPLTHGRRTLCPQTGLGDQLAGAFSPQGRQRSGFWKRGCVQAERSGLASVPRREALQEGNMRTKETFPVSS